jgi:putative alpha-1,2-mannosidase
LGWFAQGTIIQDNVIYGFSHTHLNGTGVSDFGIMIVPTMGAVSLIIKLFIDLSHANEKASAGYYAVNSNSCRC